ncbi:MFS transporter [Aliikangiella sp. IMCC44653]
MLKDYFLFAKSNFHFLLFGLLTAFFGNYGQTFFIAWFGNEFQSAFSLTNAEYGLVYSSATLVSGFIIIYVGGLLDKTALKTFTFFTTLGLAFACFLLYFSVQLWHLVVALLLLRFCGQGLMFHIAYTSMSRYFDANRGKAIGLVGFGMPIGEAILPLLAVSLIAALGWRTTWLILGFSLLALFIPYMLYLLNRSQDRINQVDKDLIAQPESTSLQWNRKQVLADIRFWVLIPMVMAPAFIVTGIFIQQNILLQSKQWSVAWFATSFVVYAISHLKSALIVGSLVDKYSGKTLIQFYLVPMFLGLVLLAQPLFSPWVAMLFMFLFGITIGAGGPIVGSLWVEVYGKKHIAAIRSMVTAIMVVSTAISPVLFGWLFDQNVSVESLCTGLLIYIAVAHSLVKLVVLPKVD